MTMRLAVVASHPIQYHAPWFRRLAALGNLDLRVLYLWDAGHRPTLDRGFGRVVQWDVPLLEGYASEFVENTSARPGTDHFRGLQNPGLPDRIRAYDPDAVLLLTCHYESVYRLLLQRGGVNVPFLFRGDSHRLVTRGGARERLHRWWLSRVYARIAAGLYVGKANHDYFRAHGIAADRLFFVPHAVDRCHFRPTDQTREEAARWRREIGVPESHRIVMFVGKLEEKKRPMTLLRAFLSASVRDATLLFVGAGPQEGELRAAAAGSSTVQFVPFQNQSAMPRTYAAADLVVLPSFGLRETWGLAVQEAMEMGRPVLVSSHVGCAPDLVRSGRNGLVFPAGDEAALAASLREALSQDDCLARWGAASREVVRDYSYERATQGLHEALACVVGSGAVRGSRRDAGSGVPHLAEA